jgi:hypothetical protein
MCGRFVRFHDELFIILLFPSVPRAGLRVGRRNLLTFLFRCPMRFMSHRAVIPARCLQMMILLTFFPGFCFPAFSLLPAGARINGIGQTSGIMRPDPFSPFIIPAALGRLDRSIAGMHYTRLFGLKELAQITCALNIKSPAGGFAFGGQRFGSQLYGETCVHAGWGMPVTPDLSVGIMAHSGQLVIDDRTRNVWWIDLGLIYRLSGRFLVGFSASNVTHQRIGPQEPLPQQTVASISCSPADQLTCTFECIKEVRFPLEIRGGIEYCFPVIAIRAGFTDSPARMTFGTGVFLNGCRLNYALVYHSLLGNTQHVSIQIVLGSPKRSPSS